MNEYRYFLVKIFFIGCKNVISMIISNASLSANLTALSSGDVMTDFCILKVFNVQNHLPKIPIIIEIIWQLPPPN
jgi:hypothetical protein